jgi:uncharacterized protein (TIGR03000 family)
MSRFQASVLTATALAVLCFAAGADVAHAGGGGHGGGGGGHGGGAGHGGYSGGAGHGGYGGYGGYHGGYGGYGHGYGGYRGFGYGGYRGFGYGYGYGLYGYGLGLGFYPGWGYGYGWGYPGFDYALGGLYGGYAPAPIYATPTVPAPLIDQMDPALLNTRGLSSQPLPPPDPSNKARIHVILPTDAVLWFEGEPTTQTGPERDFLSPQLPQDRIYTYEIKARWMQGGQPVERALAVRIQRGRTSVADFNALPPPRE